MFEEELKIFRKSCLYGKLTFLNFVEALSILSSLVFLAVKLWSTHTNTETANMLFSILKKKATVYNFMYKVIECSMAFHLFLEATLLSHSVHQRCAPLAPPPGRTVRRRIVKFCAKFF